MRLIPSSRRARVWAVAAAAAVAAVGVIPAAASGANSVPDETTFALHPNAQFINCLSNPSSTAAPHATATVKRGKLNDTMTLKLRNFAPNLGFDMFTVQRSPQKASGQPDPNFHNFGMA